MRKSTSFRPPAIPPAQPRAAGRGEHRRPLEGIRVIDLTHLIAGPFCTMLMADVGADVIKVEPPTGDIARVRPPFKQSRRAGQSMSALFLAFNRGKRSVVLDLKSPAGRRALTKLIASAHVLVENFRPGVMARLGFSPAGLAARYPTLVFASLSSYGDAGISNNYRERPGVAIVAEAASGLTGLTRDRYGRPTWIGFPLGDLSSGLTMYGAIMTALLNRFRTGAGARLDLSMAECMLALNATEMAKFQIVGAAKAYSEPLATPFGVFPTKDRFIVIGVNSDGFWVRLCTAMHRPDLVDDARFKTDAQRAVHSRAVIRIVTNWTSSRPGRELIRVMESNGVPCSLVASVDDVLRDAAYLSRGAVTPVADGLGTKVVLPANPMRLSSHNLGAVPRLGQHTQEILLELNVDTQRVTSRA